MDIRSWKGPIGMLKNWEEKLVTFGLNLYKKIILLIYMCDSSYLLYNHIAFFFYFFYSAS